MSVLVVGSVALDSVKTPFGEVKEVLGGSATYFSYAASYFAPVNLVAVVGNDFPVEYIELLRRRSVGLEGLAVEEGETFRWEGCYGYDPNDRETVSVCLNVFENFHPQLPHHYRSSEYIFLANISPELHLEILQQVKNPRLVVCDTMNIWIENKKKELLETLRRVDVLILNDAEARQLSEEHNLIKAARFISSLGPQAVVIKKGEHGALSFFEERVCFVVPAYPLETLWDPTGAGDSFAGGFVGYLANKRELLTEENIRKAIIYGSIMASFTVEEFSLNKLTTVTDADIAARYDQFKQMTCFEF